MVSLKRFVIKSWRYRVRSPLVTGRYRCLKAESTLVLKIFFSFLGLNWKKFRVPGSVNSAGSAPLSLRKNFPTTVFGKFFELLTGSGFRDIISMPQKGRKKFSLYPQIFLKTYFGVYTENFTLSPDVKACKYI